MERIKLISEEEKKRVAYPEKQSDIYLECSIKTIDGKTFPKVKELGEAIIGIKNKIIEFTKSTNILYNNIDNVKVNIDNLYIGCFKSADLVLDNVGAWVEKEATVILPIGYYYIQLVDPNKKGTLTILEEEVFEDSTSYMIEPMSLIKYKKSDIESFIGKRLNLYDNKYIIIYYSNCPFALCPIKDKLSLRLSSINNKALFKEFFNSPKDYLVALIPVLFSYNDEKYTRFDYNKEEDFTIDDIKNW